MSATDNLSEALEGARKFAHLLEAYLAPSDTPVNWPLALKMMEQVDAHLDWAKEILATRQRAAQRAARKLRKP